MSKKKAVVKAVKVPADKLNAAVVVSALSVQAKPHFAKLKKLVISDTKSYEIAAQKIEALKQLAKQAREKRDSLIDPLEKVIEDIKELFKPFLDQVDKAEEDGKAEMVELLNKLETKKKQVNSAIETGKIKKLSTAVAQLDALEISSTSSSVRNIWEVVEIDAAVTPREYMVPDRKKIKEAFKAGKKVLGWKYEQKKSIAI